MPAFNPALHQRFAKAASHTASVPPSDIPMAQAPRQLAKPTCHEQRFQRAMVK